MSLSYYPSSVKPIIERKGFKKVRRNVTTHETGSFVPTGGGVTAAAAGQGLVAMQAKMRNVFGNVTIPSHCDVGLISITREAEATQRA